MKLTIGNIEENGLPTIPPTLGADEKDNPGSSREPFDFSPISAHALGMDGFITGIQIPMYRLFIQVIHRFISG
jgi:hypothetical protein